MIDRLTAIAGIYPTRRLPYRGTFVREQYALLARHARAMQVIAPQRLFSREGWGFLDTPLPIADVSIHPPLFFPFGNRTWLNLRSYLHAVERTIAAPGDAGNAVYYAHFLYPAGICAIRAARRHGGAAFVALGESSLQAYLTSLGTAYVSDLLADAAGVICVSAKNASFCQEHFGVERSRILVAPNGVDPLCFRPRPKSEARSRLKLPPDMPIAVFVGHLIPRKGVDVAVSAMRRFPQAGLVLLGAGTPPADVPNLLHAGPVDHSEVPWWLNAADVFVFPTTAEGCPNALLEAAACGVPVVASDIPEIRELSFIRNMRLAAAGNAAAFAAALQPFLLRPPAPDHGPTAAPILSTAQRMERIAQWMERVQTMNRPCQNEKHQRGR